MRLAPEKRQVICDKPEDPRLTDLLARTPNRALTIAYNVNLPSFDPNTGPSSVNPTLQSIYRSVFKLPLAIAVLHKVERGTLSLDQPVRFLPEDRILPQVYSPLQKQYPDGGVNVPLRELLRLSQQLTSAHVGGDHPFGQPRRSGLHVLGRATRFLVTCHRDATPQIEIGS